MGEQYRWRIENWSGSREMSGIRNSATGENAAGAETERHPTGHHRMQPQYITKQTYIPTMQVGTPESDTDPSRSDEKRRIDHVDTWHGTVHQEDPPRESRSTAMGQSTRGHARNTESETVGQSGHGGSSGEQTNEQRTVNQCDQRAHKEERTTNRNCETALAASRHEEHRAVGPDSRKTAPAQYSDSNRTRSSTGR